MLQNILEEDCYMLDIESTGLSPINNGMTSFALVKFNPLAETLYSSLSGFVHRRINSSINVDMYRQNDAHNTIWRRENNIAKVEDALPCIHAVADIPKVINNFLKDANINHRNVFALHTEFDIAFLRGYFEHAGDEFPFGHRSIFELASVILGMGCDLKEIRDFVNESDEIDMVGSLLRTEHFGPHNAFYDCVRQIAFLRRALVLSGRL